MRQVTDPAAGRPTIQPFSAPLRRALAVVMIGATLPFLDSTIVNVALQTLVRDLGTPLVRVQWVVTGYLLAFAAVIPVTGWAARRMGPARLYVVALAVFTVGSALCAASTGIGMLIAARVLQGIGGGAILPVGTMIWTAQAGKAQMARAMALIGIPIVAAPMLGPTIGALLIAAGGWRAIFALNVPIGLAGLVMAVRLLPRTSPGRAGRLDVIGLALSSGGMVALTYGLSEIGRRGDERATAVMAMAAGAALLAAFATHAARIPRPLLDVRLYANRAFTAASITSFALGAAMFGGMILMPLYFQDVRGQGVIATGLLLIPSGVGALIANRATAPMTDRHGAGVTALVGGMIGLVSTVAFVFLGARTSYLLLEFAMVVRGVGVGLALVPAMTAAYRALPSHKIPDATPQLNVVQRVGGAIGTALLTMILVGGLRRADSPARTAHAFGTAFVWVLLLTAVATAATGILIHVERAGAPPGVPATARRETGP